MDIKWYADKNAKRVHELMTHHLKQMVDQMFPGHELSHLGISRDNDTEEVQIRLHLNPLGRVRVVPENSDLRLENKP